ncbi:hypothetical protein [Nonomuraea endophytica]|uniref:Uncharacterized protein n=1 Tax=Nonomuraea endophytica TaxID=714136 RepID=A0A7W8A4A9_9ACTN|nr:hypothetical protein [Nonomuraea endophytica]MBB5079258.1 hypothetical protein [Nonomuraea endophytica]
MKDEQVERLAESGWATCAPVAEAVARAGLPAVTPGYLATAFPDESWEVAERALSALREHFASARFADETTYGILLVPDPGKLDTRRPMPAEVRAGQLGVPADDVFDDRLPSGVLGVGDGRPWTMVATVTGAYGPSLGSHHQVVSGPAAAYTVAGTDTRPLMIRQLWGARVLQGGRDLPDCEANERWTFTLFPGEGLTEGLAESGTVLKGRVRFRLGKPDRGIGSARVAPAIAVP